MNTHTHSACRLFSLTPADRTNFLAKETIKKCIEKVDLVPFKTTDSIIYVIVKIELKWKFNKNSMTVFVHVRSLWASNKRNNDSV